MPSFTPYGSGPVAGASEGSSTNDASPTASLPVAQAEALLVTLPGVISARIMAGARGGVGEVHVLTGPDVAPLNTVQQVESALYARFGVRVDPRWVSVATTTAAPVRRPAPGQPPGAHPLGGAGEGLPSRPPAASGGPSARPWDARRLYFEDVEARRSSRGGLSCRVVLRRGDVTAGDPDELVEGEAESPGMMRVRADEVAARAALDALARVGAGDGFALEGSARVTAFGREFVLVGVVARQGRGATLLTGSAEVRDGGAETAAVLAILDATNRWAARVADAGGRARAA